MKDDILLPMNNFKGGEYKKKKSSKFGGKKNFGGDNKRSSGSNNQEKRSDNTSSEMFSASCSECHKKCEVPFRPSSDKPVYCSICFGAKKNNNESRGSLNSHDRSDKGLHNSRSDFTKPPRDQRSPRHNRPQSQNDNGLSDIKRQLETIESRLNRILDIINPPIASRKETLTVSKEKDEKVVLKKKVAKATVKTTSKKIVPKKTSAKAKPKKVPIKPAAKKTTKKVAPKAPAKKIEKKITKKVTKK